MADVNIVLCDLPCGIRGFVRKHNDVYTIVLNARLNREQNMETCRHELQHIREGHLDEELNIQKVEHALHERL